MREIIVNADDYGMCKSLNDGIIKAYNKGVLSSTTIMANIVSTEQMYRLDKEAKGIGIGVHLNLTQGFPLSSFSILREDGMFDRARIRNNEFDINEVEEEFIMQIEKIVTNVKKVTHIDSHHHIHLNPVFIELVKKLAIKYNLKVRAYDESVLFSDEFYNTRVSLEKFQSIISNSKGKIEIMTHPAIVDEELMSISSYNKMRSIELEILTSKELKDFYLKHELIKGTY